MAEGILVDLWRDFWISENGTGQQVAELHDRYMMMMMMLMTIFGVVLERGRDLVLHHKSWD